MEAIIIRKAKIADSEVYFKWINDPTVRAQSYNSNLVTWEDHLKWFGSKLLDPDYCFYIFQNFKNENIGQVRIQKIDQLNALISISIAIEHRGKGFGHKILQEACDDYFKTNSEIIINAFIKEENNTSKLIFEKAGFTHVKNMIYKQFNSYHYNLICK